MIDEVSAKQELLKRAAEGGSLSNEQSFRDKIAKFQGGIADHRPLVLDISSSADKRFVLDMQNLAVLSRETKDPEIARIAEIVIRSLEFLARTKGDN
jgi:hypothetical protein